MYENHTLHYGLSGEKITYRKTLLHRIIATQNISEHNIKKGEKGGWISTQFLEDGRPRIRQGGWLKDDAVLMQNGKIGVGGLATHEAIVSGNASVTGLVAQKAIVYGNASVRDMGLVTGNATVYGNAQVVDSGYIGGNSTVYGDTIIAGHGAVLDSATVFGSSLIVGRGAVMGKAKVYGTSMVTTGGVVGGTENVYTGKISTTSGLTSTEITNLLKLQKDGIKQEKALAAIALRSHEHNTADSFKKAFTKEEWDKEYWGEYWDQNLDWLWSEVATKRELLLEQAKQNEENNWEKVAQEISSLQRKLDSITKEGSLNSILQEILDA